MDIINKMEISNSTYINLKEKYPDLIEIKDIYGSLYIVLDGCIIHVLEWITDAEN